MTYNRIDTKIEATATAGSGRLVNLELIYQGESLPKEETDTESSLSKVITDKGWYTAKATDTKGRSRYAWTRANSVSGNLESPKIEVTKGVSGVENWYRDDEDGNFEIAITAQDELSSKLYYRIINSENVGATAENWIEVSGTTATIQKTELRAGQNKIYSYVADESGKGTSDDSYFYAINYDNTKPTASFTVNGESYTDENKEAWHNTDVSIEVTGEDSGSGINGYIYYLNGSETGITEKDITKPITIISEGENTVEVQTIDKAGNVSERKEVKIKLDKTAPIFSSSGIKDTNITKTGFTINVLATDKLSGSTEKGGRITYKCYITEQDTTDKVQLSPDTINTNGTFTASGLKENVRYNLEIEAEDQAGNKNSITGFVITGINGSSGNTGTTDPDNPENPDKPPVNPDPDKPTIDPGDLDPSKPGTDYPTIDGDIIPDGVTVGDRTKVTLAAATGKFVKQKYFTGKVRITLTDSEAVAGEATTLNYIIYDNRGSVVKGGQGAGPSTSFDFNREGIYILRAWTTNDTGGRLGDVTGVPLIVDQTAPTIPTIALTGKTSPIKNSIWFQSDITATISVGQDATSGVWGIGYYVEGANEIKNTASSPRIDYETRDTMSITINVDGKSTIYAYTIDDAGHVSNVRTANAWKDVTPPSSATMTFINAMGTTMYLQITVEDETSGPAQYIFETREKVEAGYNENEWENRRVLDSTNKSFQYGYEDLIPGVEYNIRMTVIDAAGNEIEAFLDGMVQGAVITMADIGKTVDYKPQNGTYSTEQTVDGQTVEYSGSAKQDFKTSDLTGNWKIWSINDTHIYLISENTTNSTNKILTLKGNTGYNNGVTLLNSICDACWKNSVYKNIEVRNIRLSDIISVLNDTVTNTNTNFGTTYSDNSRSFSSPYVYYTYDKKFQAAATEKREISYELMGSNSTPNSNLKPVESRWSLDNLNVASAFISTYGQVYKDMVCCAKSDYWLATRCSGSAYKSYTFGLQYVGVSYVSSVYIRRYGLNEYWEYTSYEEAKSIRPLLTIPLSSCYLTDGGTNGEDYHISPRGN